MLKRLMPKRMREIPLHLMMLPSVVILIIFSYGPMFGIIMAFQKYNPAKGFLKSEWVGLRNFEFLMNMPGLYQIIWNTIYIAFLKIIGMIIVPVLFSLLINEVSRLKIKRTIQTMIYLPNFMSWIILGGIMIDILSPGEGIVNKFLGLLGINPIFFLGDTFWFPITLVITDIWKGFGFGTVIYLASLTSIDPALYEASEIDGASRIKQTLHITLPGMMPIIVLMTVLSLGNILNAGFEQVLILYSPSVYDTGDIIDTLVYRLGIEQAQFSLSAAVGLFKSFVSLIFISLSYILADKIANYRVF